MNCLRIFISSPSDVQEERTIAGRVIERLQGKYWSFVRLDDVFWENKVMRATAHFQDELVNPGQCDIVIGMLWTRLGSALPERFQSPGDTSRPTGTEWELMQAFHAYEASLAETGDPQQAKPDVVIYRRTEIIAEAEEDEDRRQQRAALEDFLDREFFHQDEQHTFKRALSMYATPEEFEEKLQANLEELILRRIPALKPGFDPPPISGPPFKDLTHFDFEDNDRFFGRNRAIREVQDRLIARAQDGVPFVLIYGGSGYGKSSLMRAGLAPVLTRPGGTQPGRDYWRRVLFQPGQGVGPPCDRFARQLFTAATEREAEQASHYESWPLPGLPELSEGSLAADDTGEPWTAETFGRALADPETVLAAAASLSRTLCRIGYSLLLQVDQLEEVFTTESFTEADREAFFRALGALVRTGHVWSLATLRSEYFPRIAETPSLAALVGKDGGYILAPATEHELREIIRFPALAARLDYERATPGTPMLPGTERAAERLDEQILADTAGNASALPLLEFTLHQLYEALIDTDGHRTSELLRWDTYVALGGLKGAIARTAEERFSLLPVSSQQACDAVFANLVRVDGGNRGIVTRRRPLLAGLRQAVYGGEEFLTTFLAARLLVTDEEGGQPVVTLAHEALITHWPRLAEWIAQHFAILRSRQRLEENMRQWVESVRSPKLLLAEGRLAEAEEVERSRLFQLATEEHLLIAESRLLARRRLRKVKLVAGFMGVLAVGAGTSAWFAAKQRREAENARGVAETQRGLVVQQKDLTDESLYFASIAAAQDAIQQGNAREALRLLAAAPEQHRSWEYPFLLRRAGFVPWQLRRSQLALLDTGPLKGSGLLEAATKLLNGAEGALEVHAGHYTSKRSPIGDRGGARLEVTFGREAIEVVEYRTNSYGNISGLWIAPDGSCLLAATGAVRVQTMSSDDLLPPAGTLDGPEIMVLPIPRQFSTEVVTLRESTTTGQDNPLASKGKGKESTAPPEDDRPPVTAPMLSRSGNDHGEVTAGGDRYFLLRSDPEKPGGAKTQVLPHAGSGTGLSFEDSILLNVPAESREAARQWLEDPQRHLLAVDANSPLTEVLSVRLKDGTLELAPLADLSKTRAVILPGTVGAWRQAARYGSNSNNSGSVFSADGKKILLSPVHHEQAGILDRSTLKLISTLHGEAAFGPLKMGLNDNLARPGEMSWSLSPKGTYAALIAEDAPHAQFHTGICRTDTGESLHWPAEEVPIAVDWDSTESFFASYEPNNEMIRVRQGLQGPLLNSFKYQASLGEALIWDTSSFPDRLVIGHHLVRRSDLRPVLTLPSQIMLAPDWSWAALLQKDSRDEKTYLHLAEFLGAFRQEPTLADRLQQLQVTLILGTSSGSRSAQTEAVTQAITTVEALRQEVIQSFPYRLAHVRQGVTWLTQDGWDWELTEDQLKSWRQQAAATQPLAAALLAEQPNSESAKWIKVACDLILGQGQGWRAEIERHVARDDDKIPTGPTEAWEPLLEILDFQQAFPGQLGTKELHEYLASVREVEAQRRSRDELLWPLVNRANSRLLWAAAGLAWQRGQQEEARELLAVVATGPDSTSPDQPDSLRAMIDRRQFPAQRPVWMTLLPPAARQGMEAAIKGLPADFQPSTTFLAMARKYQAEGHAQWAKWMLYAICTDDRPLPFDFRYAAIEEYARLLPLPSKRINYTDLTDGLPATPGQKLISVGREYAGLYDLSLEEFDRSLLREAVDGVKDKAPADLSPPELLGLIGACLALQEDGRAYLTFQELVKKDARFAEEAYLQVHAWDENEWKRWRPLLSRWIAALPKAGPTPAATSLRAMRLALLKDDDNTAWTEFQKALTAGAEPTPAEWNLMLPTLARRLGGPATPPVLPLIERAATALPNSPTAQATLALAYAVANQDDAAARVLLETSQRHADFREVDVWSEWRSGLKSDSKVLSSAMERLLEYSRVENFRDAIALIHAGERILQRAQNSQSILEAGRRAAACAAEALRREPGNFEAVQLQANAQRFIALGHVALALEDPQQIDQALAALNTLTEMTGLEADFAQAVYFTGRVARLPEHEKFLAAAKAKFPDSYPVGQMLALLQLRAGHPAEAARRYQALLAHPDAKDDLGTPCWLAVSQWLSGRKHDAIATYREVIARDAQWKDHNPAVSMGWFQAYATVLNAIRLEAQQPPAPAPAN